MDFENLFDIGGNEREADQVKKHQKSKEEIDRYSVEENMNDVDRAIFLLKKGTASQRLSLLTGCVQQIFPYSLRSNETSTLSSSSSSSSFSSSSTSLTPLMILDKLLPYLTSLCPSSSPSSTSSSSLVVIENNPSYTEEHQATLEALLAIGCTSNLFSSSIVSTRIIPIFLRLFNKNSSETMVQFIGESLTTLILRNAVTLPCIQNDILPATLNMGNVANTPQQRILAVKVLLGLVTHFSTALISSLSSSSGTSDTFSTNNLNIFLPIIESLLGFCQDTDARIRTLLASSLGNIVASIWFAVPSSALSSNVVFMSVSRCRDRCIEELFELVGDEDTIVRTAAMESTIDLTFRQDNKYLPKDRRNELWDLLRKQWEHLTASSSSSSSLSVSSTENTKDDQMRLMFAQRSGRICTILLHPFIDTLTTLSKITGTDDTTTTKLLSSTADPNSHPPVLSSAPPNDESTARQRRITRRASVTGTALVSPASAASASLNNNDPGGLSKGSSSSLTAIQEATMLQSYVRFFQSLTIHKSEDIRNACVRSLPGIWTSLTLCLGPPSNISGGMTNTSSSTGGTANPTTTTEDKSSVQTTARRANAPTSAATSSSSSSSSSTTTKPTITVPVSRMNVDTNPSPTSGVSLLSSLANNNSASIGGNSNSNILPHNRDEDLVTDIFFTPLPKLTTMYNTFLHAPSSTVITNDYLALIGTYHLRTFALPYLHRTVTDSSISLRQTLSTLLHHIIATLGYARATRCLTPYIYTLLNDNDDTVVRTLLLTSHIWLPYLTCPDSTLRLQMGALIIPSLFQAILRPAIKVLWRVQIAFLASLRWLVFIYPAPNVMEASLNLCHRYVVTGCKGVRSSAIHTIVWFSRHAPTTRVRNAAREYLIGQFVTSRSIRSQIAQTLVQNHPLAPGTQPGTLPSSNVSSSGTVSSTKSGITLTDMNNTLAGTIPINLGNGYMIPLEAALDILCPLNGKSTTVSVLPPSTVPNMNNNGNGTVPLPVLMPLPSLSGPSWRRECVIEACGASLWLYSRTYIKTTFLPAVLDSALYDPVVSVRTTAIRGLGYLRAWFILPMDSAVIDNIRYTLEVCSKDPRKLVSNTALQQIQLLRKYDTTVVQTYMQMHYSSPTLFPVIHLSSLVVHQDTLPEKSISTPTTITGTPRNPNSSSPILLPKPAVEILNPSVVPAGRRRSSINKQLLNDNFGNENGNLTSSPVRNTITPTVTNSTASTTTLPPSLNNNNNTVSMDVIGKIAVLVSLTVAANESTAFGKESLMTINSGQRIKSQFVMNSSFSSSPSSSSSSGGNGIPGVSSIDGCSCFVTPATEESRGTTSTAFPDPLSPSLLPAKLWLEHTIFPMVDGIDGVYNQSVFLRNPFRINITHSLPVIPVQACYNGVNVSTINNKNSNTHGYVELDNIVGLQTAITVWDSNCLQHPHSFGTYNTPHSITKSLSSHTPFCSVMGTYINKSVANIGTLTSSSWYDNAAIVRSQMEEIEEGILGRIFMPRDNINSVFGSTPSTGYFSSPSVPSSATFSNPVNCSLVPSYYHPYQLLCPVPHSSMEESFRLSCENALGGTPGEEESSAFDKLRVNSKKGNNVSSTGNNLLSSITDVLNSPRMSTNEAVSPVSSFSPIGWPPSLAVSVGNIASGAIPLASPFILPPSTVTTNETTPRGGTNNSSSTVMVPNPLPSPHNVLITLPSGLQVGNNGPVNTGGITLQLQSSYASINSTSLNGNSSSSSTGNSNGSVNSTVSSSGSTTPSASTASTATKMGTTGASLSLLNGKSTRPGSNTETGNGSTIIPAPKGSIVPIPSMNTLNSNDNLNTGSNGTNIFTSLIQIPFSQFLNQSVLTPTIIATNLHSLQNHPSIQPIPLSLSTPTTTNNLSSSTNGGSTGTSTTGTSKTATLARTTTTNVGGNNNDSLSSLTNRLSSGTSTSNGTVGGNTLLPLSTSRAAIRVSITPSSIPATVTTNVPTNVSTTSMNKPTGTGIANVGSSSSNDTGTTNMVFGSRRTISALANAGSKVSSTTTSGSTSAVPSSSSGTMGNGSSLPPTHGSISRVHSTPVSSNSSLSTSNDTNNSIDVLSRLLNSNGGNTVSSASSTSGTVNSRSATPVTVVPTPSTGIASSKGTSSSGIVPGGITKAYSTNSTTSSSLRK